MNRTKSWLAVTGLVALAFTAVACGSDNGSTPAASSAAPSAAVSSAAPMTSAGGMTTGGMSSEGGMSSGSGSAGTSGGAAAGMDLVGPGCADYAAANPDGPASVGGMATAKVAEAASANPLLTTLVAAVSGKVNPDVNLVDTLNGGEFTVFAPVDSAFEKIPADTMKTLTTDSDLLTKILTYHVISGQIAPDAIVGTHETVEGESLTVAGSGDQLTVDGTTMVICGGVTTANATVYLIDTVLMPPSLAAGASSESATTS